MLNTMLLAGLQNFIIAEQSDGQTTGRMAVLSGQRKGLIDFDQKSLLGNGLIYPHSPD